ncbi:Uncharacterised protein [Mycobacteroides abscessus subsp. abscessus]|nr:Uncharacterised protein [Mycobacteroides abscessus subsp. abscessus]
MFTTSNGVHADSDPAGFTAQRSECKDEGEQVGVAYAAQLYGSAPSSHYSKLGPSTPAVKGYVAVWGSGLPNGTGGAGHVAIVLADQGGSLQILTQNPGATHIGSMSAAYLTGLLRPKNLTPPSNNPIGSIDEVASPRAGVVRIRGWALDRDDAAASIQVHAHVGGQAGAPNTEGHPFVANGARPAVNSTIGVPGNHGFDATFAVSKSGNVPVCLYGINIGGGSNVLLGCRTVGIADRHPARQPRRGEGARLWRSQGARWTFDPSDSGKNIDVHVYVGPQPGQSGSYANVLKVSRLRPDVNTAYGITGNRGFETTVYTKLRGPQTVCAYGINIGEGSTNPQVGCKTVSVK